MKILKEMSVTLIFFVCLVDIPTSGLACTDVKCCKAQVCISCGNLSYSACIYVSLVLLNYIVNFLKCKEFTKGCGFYTIFMKNYSYFAHNIKNV